MVPLRGAAAVIAERMEESLEVPTATSVRTVPAKLLELNRTILNRHLVRKQGAGKVSFTHLIGWAVVQAVAPDARDERHVPHDERRQAGGDPTPSTSTSAWRSTSSGRTARARSSSRTSSRPRRWTSPGSSRRTRSSSGRSGSGKLAPDDFAGTTVSITNPGMIGTVQSVPRLMAGQALHRGGRFDRVPGRVRRRRPRDARRARRRQGRDRHQHVRPPRDPGRRVGGVPADDRTPAARRGRLLRGGLPVDGRAVRPARVAGGRQPGRATPANASRSRPGCSSW